MHRLMFTAVLVSALCGLTACGDDDDDGDGASTLATNAAPTSAAGGGATTAAGGSGTTAGGEGSGATITITEFAFPAETRVAAGQPVTVTNETNATHTLTALSGGFDEEVDPGETIEFTVEEPGSYDYVCNFHGNMSGVLTVE